MQGGCGGFCNMGTCYFSFLGLFRSLFVLQAHPACFYFSLHHNPIAFMHENYKASKACKEKETKDASSIVNVKWYQVLTFGIFPILLPPIYWLGSWPFVTISTGLAYHSSLDCVSSDSTHSKSTEVYNWWFLHQDKLIQLVDLDHCWRQCGLVMLGSCHNLCIFGNSFCCLFLYTQCNCCKLLLSFWPLDFECSNTIRWVIV